MVKATLSLLLLLVLVAAAHAQTVALLPLDTPLGQRARDATGTVWAISTGGTTGAIFRRRTNGWQTATFPEAADLVARSLTRGEDGAVYAFWQTQNGTPSRSVITVHRGANSRVLAKFPALEFGEWPANGVPTLFVGAGGDVWLASSSPVLYHVTPDGVITPFPLKPEQYVGGHLPQGPFQAQTSSVVDGKGRRWFWQGGNPFWPPGRLRGLLIWDGKQMEYQASLPSFVDTRVAPSAFTERVFLTLAPLDAHHLWLSVLGFPWEHPPRGGLYRLDTDTLKTTLVPPPEAGAFQNVTQVFRANGDWYVVEMPMQGSRIPYLWRSQGQSWRKCVSRLEEPDGYYAIDGHYPWRTEPDGVWLGTQAGVWWIPNDNSPSIWVDWRRGINASAWDMNSGLSNLPPSPPPLLPTRPNVTSGAMGGPKELARLISDPHRHLWGTRRSWSGSFPLDEWDGFRWRTQVAPKGIATITGLYACDTESRIWLNTQTWPTGQPAPSFGIAIYDPLHKSWVDYHSLEDALEASVNRPGLKFLPNHDTSSLPAFSGDGRVVYNGDKGITLYEGHDWRHWQVREIKNGSSAGNLAREPTFNAEGNLQVGLWDGQTDETWEWTLAESWHPTGERKQEGYVDPVPPGGPHGLWAVPIVDDQGRKWFTGRGNVYAAAHGLWAKYPALSGLGSPFWDGRGLEDILRDPLDRLFFRTRPGGYYDFVVWTPPSAPPAPRIEITPLAADAVAFHFAAQGDGTHWFLWRLNGGEWSAPQKPASVILSDLKPGDYRVEAQAMDMLLQTSYHPSSAAFTLRAATPAQIAQWVQTLLTGPDDARETAAKGLAKQPDLALPTLRAAQPGASEAGRWWVDAVIQQIEDGKARATERSTE